MAAAADNPSAETIEPEPELPPADETPAGISPLPASRLLAIVLAVGAGSLLVWLVPPLGLILAWPFLFLVPGWLLIERVAPHLPAPGRLGLAVVSSVYVSAHLVNLVARVDGFSRAAVLLSVAILVLASVL
ncbi:MAG: hypothetical protein QOJ75_2443, partial [Chloroflexota bacterium]|nr:hypothetical protein [Chloroflexota bacterium]